VRSCGKSGLLYSVGEVGERSPWHISSRGSLFVFCFVSDGGVSCDLVHSARRGIDISIHSNFGAAVFVRRVGSVCGMWCAVQSSS
jgi:hypothetical protein